MNKQWLVKLMPIALVPLAAAWGSTLPGTRMEVDWPALVSGQDLILTTPPQSAIHGLLMGNGDIGVSAYGAPDCLILQVGKNDIWDYRDAAQQLHKTVKPVTFQQIFRRLSGTGAGAWKEPYKRPDKRDLVIWQHAEAHLQNGQHEPKPAGQIRFRNPRLRSVGYAQRLHLWDAEVTTEVGQPLRTAMRTFVSSKRNLIVIQYVPSPKQRWDIELARHKDTTGTIPDGPKFGASGRDIWLTYHFPASDPYPDGFEYAMYGRVLGGSVQTEIQNGQSVAHVTSSQPVTVLVAVDTTRDSGEPFRRARNDVNDAQRIGLAALIQEHRKAWHAFWQRSFVQIPNAYLNRQWFLSNYHQACAARSGKIMPGLDGNWSWEDDPAWFAAYYWNTCAENLFYGAYSSNHLEQTVPYNDTVFDLLPAARKEAREVFGMRGAKFPHTSYPHSTSNPTRLLLPYDWQMCETPWAVQQVWWYYLYSHDKGFLRKQGYPLMRAVSMFFVDYLKRGGDGKFDLCPTFPPEMRGLYPGFKYNRNCIADLSLIKYVLKAAVAASLILHCDSPMRDAWKEIADNLAAYPTAEAPEGRVFVDVENAPYPYDRYNLPIPTMAIFPGEDIGLDSPAEVRETALRTFKALHEYPPTQGYIMLPMAGVRLGIDTLGELETCTRRCSFLNGAVFTDGHRWIWAENFGMPIVINESIMQSYTGRLRVAPVKMKGGARFGTLRAVGAFLVSGELRPDGGVSYLAITSQAGLPCPLVKPWDGAVRVRQFPSMRPVVVKELGDTLVFETRKGSTYVVDRPQAPWEDQPVVKVSAAPAKARTPEWYRVEVPGAWNRIQFRAGRFIPVPEGAIMYSQGSAGATAGWELPIAPLDTARYHALQLEVSGVGNGSVRVQAIGANGGEVIARQDWKLPENVTILRLNLPPLHTIVAVSVFTTTDDGKPLKAIYNRCSLPPWMVRCSGWTSVIWLRETFPQEA